MFHDGKLNYKYSIIFFTTTVINATLLSTISMLQFLSLPPIQQQSRKMYVLPCCIHYHCNTYHVTISVMLAELNYRKKNSPIRPTQTDKISAYISFLFACTSILSMSVLSSKLKTLNRKTTLESCEPF